jgi:hypothetical protein
MTHRHRYNLARLAIAVLDSPYELEMHAYQGKREAPKERETAHHFYPLQHLVQPECGTTACFLGHGPWMLPDLKLEIDIRAGSLYWWREYAQRHFGCRPMVVPDEDEGEIWDFLFNQKWPNDKRACAERALHILEDREPIHHFHKEKYLSLTREEIKHRLLVIQQNELKQANHG